MRARIKVLLGGLAGVVLAVAAWAQGTGVNPPVGAIWTYLGATYGAGWAPSVTPSGPLSYGCISGLDSTTCFQNMFNSAPAGSILMFPPGNWIVSGPVTIAKPFTICGAGHPKSDTLASIAAAGYTGTIITVAASYPSGDVFKITATNPVVICDLMFNSVAQRTGGAFVAAIGGTPNTDPANAVRNLNIRGVMYNHGYDDFREDFGIFGHFDDNIHLNFKRYGDYIAQNDTALDYGDAVWSRNMYWELEGPTGTCDAGLYAEATGLFTVFANKFNGCKHGVWVNLKHGPTGTTLVTSNSFENHTVDCMALTQGVAGKEYAMVTFSNNQALNFWDTPQGCFYVAAGTLGPYQPKWVRQISVIGNNFARTASGTTPMINIIDGVGMTVIGNTCDGVNKDFNTTFPCIGGTELLALGSRSMINSNNAVNGAYMPDHYARVFQGGTASLRFGVDTANVYVEGVSTVAGDLYESLVLGGKSLTFVTGSGTTVVPVGQFLTSGQFRLYSPPTSCATQPQYTVWNNAGMLGICP